MSELEIVDGEFRVLMNEVKECCNTCRKFYIEYGMELCKCHEEPMDDVNEKKCSEYERFWE